MSTSKTIVFGVDAFVLARLNLSIWFLDAVETPSNVVRFSPK